jgi:RHS repeat-associated protein
MNRNIPASYKISPMIYPLTFLLILIVSNSVFAIGENYDQIGFRSNTTYIKYSLQEYINPFAGNLILSHTDIVLPGKGGLDLKIQRTYNSKILNDPDTGELAGITFDSMGIGWSFHFGRISIVTDPIFLQMGDGSFYILYDNNHSNINSHITSDYITEDLWIVNYDETNDRYVMTLPDGTVYTFGQHITNFSSYNYYYVTSIKDTNGNEISIQYFDCCNMDSQNPNSGNIGTCPSSDLFTKTRHIKQVIDSVGRVINFGMLNDSCRGNAVSSIDVNGKTYNYLYYPGPDGPSSPFTYYDGGSTRLLKEVKPPEGPSWQYFYDADGVAPDGELISVTYPSGGVVEYEYDTFDLQLQPTPADPFKLRAVSTRATSGPNIVPGTWTYSYSYDTSINQGSTTVTGPCDDKEIYKFARLPEDPIFGLYNRVWEFGLLEEKEVRDINNNLIQTEINDWNPYQISTGIFYDESLQQFGVFVPLLGSKTIVRDGGNYVTNYTYNTFYGEPTKIEESGGLIRTTNITYFENLSGGSYIVAKPRIITVTDGIEAKTITNSYDTKGNLTSEDKYGVITEFSYHPDGSLEWEKNARGFYTHFDQYNFGVAGRIRYGSSSELASDPVYTETRAINWEGTVASFTNGRGHQTLFNYDLVNRLTKVTPPPSGEGDTLITYENTSGRSYKIKKGVSEVQYNFDGLGRPVGTQSNVGVNTEIRYDQCGRKVYESLPFDSSVPNTGDSFTYDVLGRVKSITHPDSTAINYSYSGNSVTITNERNLDTILNFKSFGDPEEKRLISVKDTQNNTTSYEYDILGNLIRVDSPTGGDRVFSYNPKNFLVSETHPESGTTAYTHDEIGNVITKTDAKNQTTLYQYDALNRLTFIDHPSNEHDVTYAYDNANNRTLMQSSSGGYSYSYQYDQSNRLTQQSVNLGSISYIVDFVYDERNNLIRAIYPSGEIVNYNYDAGNRLLDAFDASNVLFVGNITNHPSGAPTHYVNANSVSSDFTYDNRHRLKTIKISRPFPELKVIKEGLGDGTVTSNPLGIDCGDDCSQIYPADGITVTLTALPDQDSNFVSWGGDPDCSDGVVLMNMNKTCIATFALIPNQFTLTVSKEGTGTGTVTSSPAGIDCGSDCTENYDASTQVTLTPTPDTGSSFTGWSGDADCSDGVVTMDANKTCTATFEPIGQFTLTVNKVGTGTGTITSSPTGIDCGSDCTENYDANISVTLTATPAVGSKFVAWTGDADCPDGTVTMDTNKNCTAQFSPLFTLTIQKEGTGSGTVVSVNYGGINCGNDCSEGYDENSAIQLNATPDPGSQFAGWSGNPDCSDGLVTMDVNKTCIATFNLLPPNQFTLSVNKEGDGFGTVTSSPGGISCGNDCNHNFDNNTEVTLNAAPNAGSIFEGWGGDPDCSDGIVTMSTSKTCTATFIQSSQLFSLSMNVSGFGLVNADFFSDNGISCFGPPELFNFSNDCIENYPINTRITLVPKTTSSFTTDPPIDYDSAFIEWSGDPDCLDGEVTMDANKNCTAIFTPFKLTVNKVGNGTVIISPEGNTCTTFSACSKYYHPNTQVTLTTIPNAGSVFSGWSGDPDCSDGTVIMDAEKNCTATFTTSSDQFTLTVGKSGTGTGTVTSNPSGISCGSDCTQDYAVNSQITLTAVTDAGSIFDGWSGDPDCSDGTVRMDVSKSCTATFTQSSNQFTLTITKSGTGTGTITSSPVGIDCGSDCTENYAINTVVSLTVTPDPGSRFVEWSGDQGCGDQVTLNANKNCIATFEPDQFTLTVTKSGVGTGNVTSSPAGIDCGSDCSENYPPNTQVTLTAVPDAGFIFAGWTGNDEDCYDGIVTIDFSKNCTARFGLPSTHFAYVTNYFDNTISVIDTSANIVVDTITVGDSPIGIAISPDDAFIYAANQGSDSVSVVDILTNSVIDTISVGFGPRHLAVSPDGARAYVVNEFDNSVSVIDTATNAVINTITVGDLPQEIAVNPDGTRAYVTNHVDGSVSVIDTSTNTVIDTVFVGILPKGIAVRPDGNLVYVVNSRDDVGFPDGNSVSVIDTLTNSVITNISVGTGPWSLSFNPDGTRLYVVHTEDDVVSVINTATNSVINTLSVGLTSSDIAVSPDGDKLYLVHDFDSLVSVVDVSTGSVVDTINVGDFPVEIVTSGFENVPPEQFVLTVTKTGNGTVTSSPAGIDCGSDCTENYNVETEVTLTATPDAGSSFSGWSGDEDCSDGEVTMDANKNCTATFAQQFTLTVTKTGNGTGTVTSSPSGINCGSDCTQDYASGAEVTLTATPSFGSGFTGWSGDPDCSDGIVTMDANKTCTATFGTATLTVSKAGSTGTGTVTSNPAGINCGSDCTQNYPSNTEVALTATPNADSVFAGWNGDADCSDGTVTMDVDKTCIATFNKPKLTVTKNGTGTGTVTSSPSGISCGSDCTQNYNLNTQVTLTATPTSGHIFIGWSGDPDCSDGVVTMNEDKTCTATFNVNTLTVTKTGNGTGTVTSSPSGINCGSDCTQNYAGNTQVSLTATPATGSIFGGWSGDPDCSDGIVVMNEAKTCTATFTQASGQFTLTLNKAGTGTGTVTSSPAGINCGSDCTENYNSNTQVTLTAIPSADSVFAGWTGTGCTTGVVTMNAHRTCTATFNRPKLTVTRTGTGTGTVTSSPSGISCGSDCNENYDKNTQVTLTATPATGSTFAGWSGNADCSDGVVTMDVDKTCTATFNKPKLTVTKNGTGTGTVTSSPSGINCGSDCNQNYNLDTQVTLTATPGTGSIFAGWSGNADCSDGTVIMDIDKTCTATFNQSSASIYNSKGVIMAKAEDLSNNSGRSGLITGTLRAVIASVAKQSPLRLLRRFTPRNDTWTTVPIYEAAFSEKSDSLENRKDSSLYSRLSSCVESLRLSVVSLLFATTAYAQTVPPTTFIDLEYSYDGVGNVTGIIDHIDSQKTRSMQYDNLDRLTTASGPWGPGSFTYDFIGNRTSKAIGSSNVSYSYGPSDNRLSGYSHDANGNVLEDDNFTYEYDSENRLTRVLSGASVIAEYKYDGDGRRISKTVEGVTTYYAYGPGLNVLTEFNSQGVPKFDYIYAGSRNVARVNFDANGAPESKTFYHTDHLGSNIAMTDATSTVVWDQGYLPFGEPHVGSGSIENSRQYTGKEFEEETGLYYYGARYYHSGLGRFMSVDPAPADPADPQSWNRYAYVLNNPYKYVDPDGRCPDDPLGLVASKLCTGDVGGPVGLGGGNGKGLNLGRLFRLALPSGPKRLAIPKPTSISTEKFVYDVRTGRYRNTETGQFVSQRNLPYPPNRGFVSSSKGIVPKGTIIDRYGRPSGRYAGQPGTTISERGMPKGSESLEYHRYKVLKPIDAEIGPAAPVSDFGASGGSTQYLFNKSIEKLVQEGFLVEIP